MVTDEEKYALQQELIELFQRYDITVAVGLTRAGIALRSQDERVDARNIGEIRAQ